MKNELLAAMVQSLAMMDAAGLKSYGNFPKDEQGLKMKASVYLSVAVDACRVQFGDPPGLTSEIIQSAAKSLFAQGGDFPDAATFARAVKDAWDRVFVPLGFECESEDGSEPIAIVWVKRDAISDRNAIEAKKKELVHAGFELVDKQTSALPVTDEQIAMVDRMIGRGECYEKA
jgi:hypothetical protein